jgi:acetolactate synthase-1/3 small subunit
MTIVTRGNEDVIEQITKQLNKLIDVVKLIDLAEIPHVECELMLVKVAINLESREEIKRLVDIFRGKVIDVSSNSYVIEMTGASDKLDAFIKALDTKCIIETVRSGPTSMSRGADGLHL